MTLFPGVSPSLFNDHFLRLVLGLSGHHPQYQPFLEDLQRFGRDLSVFSRSQGFPVNLPTSSPPTSAAQTHGEDLSTSDQPSAMSSDVKYVPPLSTSSSLQQILLQSSRPPSGNPQLTLNSSAPRKEPPQWYVSEETLAWTTSKIAAYSPAQKVYKCIECKEAIGFLAKVAEHWLGTHGCMRAFRCPRCPYNSMWARCVRMHFNRAHDSQSDLPEATLWASNPMLVEVNAYLSALRQRAEEKASEYISQAAAESSRNRPVLDMRFLTSVTASPNAVVINGSPTMTTTVADSRRLPSTSSDSDLPPRASDAIITIPRPPSASASSAQKKDDKKNRRRRRSAATPSPQATARRYHCNQCNYATDRRDLYSRHYNIHQDEKPYWCYVCEKQFNRADHVKKHFTRIHTDIPYESHRIKRWISPSSSSFPPLGSPPPLETNNNLIHDLPPPAKHELGDRQSAGPASPENTNSAAANTLLTSGSITLTRVGGRASATSTPPDEPILKRGRAAMEDPLPKRPVQPDSPTPSLLKLESRSPAPRTPMAAVDPNLIPVPSETTPAAESDHDEGLPPKLPPPPLLRAIPAPILVRASPPGVVGSIPALTPIGDAHLLPTTSTGNKRPMTQAQPVSEIVARCLPGTKDAKGCPYCDWVGEDKWAQKRHINTHLRPFACPMCDYKAGRSERLRNHAVTLHGVSLCTAYIGCLRPFDTKFALYNHTVFEHKSDPVFRVCPWCGQHFESPNRLDDHVSAEHPGKEMFPCFEQDCSFIGLSQSMFLSHMRSKHGDPEKALESMSSIPQEQSQGKNGPNLKRNLVDCPECGCGLGTLPEYLIHSKKHHDFNKEICVKCFLVLQEKFGVPDSLSQFLFQYNQILRQDVASAGNDNDEDDDDFVSPCDFLAIECTEGTPPSGKPGEGTSPTKSILTTPTIGTPPMATPRRWSKLRRKWTRQNQKWIRRFRSVNPRRLIPRKFPSFSPTNRISCPRCPKRLKNRTAYFVHLKLKHSRKRRISCKPPST